MITLTHLHNFLTEFMVYDKNQVVSAIDPYMANGLMVKGSESITKVGLAVSASIEVFKKAKEKKCQALIVHHSFNFPSTNRYDELFHQRYAFLVKNNLSLFGYHFLLDSHPKIGHNAEIIRAIGGKITKPFLHGGQPWGYIGELKSVALTKILNLLKPKLSPTTVIYPYGNKNIKTVVAVSGRGTPIPPDIQWMIDNHIDLYITGENSEWIREIFREIKINFIAGGHYHTERFGILALQKIIDQKLKVKTEFIEHENTV